MSFVDNGSNMQAIGTKDSLITFKPDTYRNNWNVRVKGPEGNNTESNCDWCYLENGYFSHWASSSDGMLFKNTQFIGRYSGSYGLKVENSMFNESAQFGYDVGGHIKNSTIMNPYPNNMGSSGWQYHGKVGPYNMIGTRGRKYDYIGGNQNITYELKGYYNNYNRHT